jgi:phospholipid/cholesterol/gamma-HCH transport system substrate-binding protein
MSAPFRARGGRTVTALAGLLFVVLIAGLAVVGVAFGFGAFSTSKTVTARLPEAGPALGPGAEVEYRGVLVGSLHKLVREPTQAVLTIHLDPSQVDHIPAGVTVRLVPRSVFGDLYVDLVPPATIRGHIQPGAVLSADTSTPTVELNQALDAGYRLLTAIQPAKLNHTLTAIATALTGRGAKIRELISAVSHYSAQIAPQTAQFLHDLGGVGTLARQISANSADIFRILDDSIVLSQSIAADQPTLRRVLAVGPVAASRTKALLASNRQTLVRLVRQLRPVITILNANQANLINTLAGLEAFTTGAARALGHGAYLKVAVAPDSNFTRGRAYTKAECPHYGRMKGPNCPGASPRHFADPAGFRQRLAIARVLGPPYVAARAGARR